jgi:hypothetical protein
MDTDRELLEWAAKAAGYQFTVSREWHDKGRTIVNGEYWHPLTNDGDTFRLAVKLGLHIEFDMGVVRSPSGEILAVGPTDIRRAIVRAAAELGKSAHPPKGA